MRRLLLPSPSPIPRTGLDDAPLVIAGMYRTGSGLGRAAKGCFDALQQDGLSPLAVDLSEMFHQAEIDPAVPLSPFPHSRKGTLILFANPPEVERALMGLGLRRWHDWHIIGAWVWELPVAPAGWSRQAAMVSEIWAPSRFVAEAFSARYDRPVRTVPHHVPLCAPVAPPRTATEPVRIFAIADARSSLERKNPMAAIRMFRAAFEKGERAELVVKCRNLSLFPAQHADLIAAIDGDPRIRLLDRTQTPAEQAALLDSADILLSPHRSEGFGLNLAEAMAAGKCVIATGWSGNLDFMPEGSAALLPYTLVPAVDPAGVYVPEPGAVWAEPDFEAGVTALRNLAADPEKRAAMGALARAAVEACLGPRPIRDALTSLPQPA